MKAFRLHLQSSTQYERHEGVTAFVGEDPSGSFGLLPGHERLMTSLVFGLARFRAADGEWEFLAVPRAIVYFAGNELYLSTRRFLRDRDSARITQALEDQLQREEAGLRSIKASLQQLEEEMFKRLWKMGRRAPV